MRVNNEYFFHISVVEIIQRLRDKVGGMDRLLNRGDDSNYKLDRCFVRMIFPNVLTDSRAGYGALIVPSIHKKTLFYQGPDFNMGDLESDVSVPYSDEDLVYLLDFEKRIRQPKGLGLGFLDSEVIPYRESRSVLNHALKRLKFSEIGLEESELKDENYRQDFRVHKIRDEKGIEKPLVCVSRE